MLIDADWYADWYRLMPTDTDWCWLIMLDADWFWLMLTDSDWSWLVLIELINAAWCWLMFINAQMRFNRVFCCQSVPPELLRSFLNKGTDKLILEVLVFCLLACFPLTWSFDQWSLVIGQTVRCLIWGWSVGSWLTELHPFRQNMISTLYELVWIGLNQFVWSGLVCIWAQTACSYGPQNCMWRVVW